MNLTGLRRSDLEHARSQLLSQRETAVRRQQETVELASEHRREMDRLHAASKRNLQQQGQAFQVVRVGVGVGLAGLFLTLANTWFAVAIPAGLLLIAGGVVAMKWLESRDRVLDDGAERQFHSRIRLEQEHEALGRQLARLALDMGQVDEAILQAPPDNPDGDPARMAAALAERGTGVYETGSTILVGGSRLRRRKGAPARFLEV